MNNNQRINQLLMQTRGLSSTNLEATALIERLRKEAFALAAWSCREIDRITAERDEARREWCRLWGHTQGRNVAPTQAARLRAWDCFKKGKA
jgi:hypothetical protein